MAQDDGSVYYYNETENKTQWTHPALGEDEEIVIDLLDPSMIFSLERTTLSGFNQGFQIMMVGAGIMTVKNAQAARHTQAPVNLGLTFFVFGVLFTAYTWYTHLRRMHVLKHGDRKSCYNWQWSSIYWISILGAALTAAFAIELYYTLEHPLFDRNKIVEVAS